MKKKILLSILILLTFNRDSNCQDTKIVTDWLFVYYMPYDNNLSEYGEEIIQMIRDSLNTNKVIVTVQSDYIDTLGMQRLIISKDKIIRTSIKNEFSASTQTYQDYLKWALSSFEYKKIAVIFLDHGGKLDELCLDEKPIKSFLKVDSLQLMFSQQVGNKKIDLLFLQVCTKGSIEPVYEFKDIAKYTLCSQIELGAPNYYYQGLFGVLSKSTEAEGDEVARIIIKKESDNMYKSFTIINNKKLDSLDVMIKQFSDQILTKPQIRFLRTPLSADYYGETYWDIISFFENMDLTNNPLLHLQRNQIINYILNEVILLHKTNPNSLKMKNFSGLSMSAFTNEKEYNNLYFYKLLGSFRKIWNLN